MSAYDVGWSRVSELTRGRSAATNPAFVAMFFGGIERREEMNEVFDAGIRPALEQAGYHATRVDRTEHNDWIIDRILGGIRLAPFVVADFTDHRSGVYYEAGFAHGLGIPVIYTCQEDDFHKVHFDTAQRNHILWKTPEDLRIKLYHRVLATIGLGPHPIEGG